MMPALPKPRPRKQVKSKISLLSTWTFWACICAILGLSLAPPSTPMPTTGWDKSNHVLAFVVLTFLARKVWAEQFWLVLLSLLAYGALIELLQSLMPYRHAEWSDLWADGLGLLVGTIFTRRNSPLNTVVDDLRV
ncbi:hypothetical protein GmRootV35_11920 [Variovorax sp. V35]